MIIEEVYFGYHIYITVEDSIPSKLNNFRMDVDSEYGVNIPATGFIKRKEDIDKLREAIEVAYKLYSGEIKIIRSKKDESKG